MAGGHRALKYCRLFFWLNLIVLGGLLIVASLHRSHPRIREVLVDLRNSTTRRASTDAGLFALDADGLMRRGFQTDRDQTVEKWRPALAGVAPVRGDVAALDDVATVEALVQSFSRGGGERPIYFMPLVEKISAARLGSGFCSDHVKIFLALARVHGLFGREVQNEVHAFADFYSARQGKWIFVDPMYAVLATDSAGAYLSSLELRERRLNGLPVRFVFFGPSGTGVHSDDDPRFKRLYDAAQFNRYVLTFGNNVLTEASQSAALAWLPWEARQIILYLVRTKPPFVHLLDRYVNDRETNAARRRVVAFGALAAYFAVALVSYPLLLIRTRRRAGEGERPLTEGAVGKLPLKFP